MADGAAGWADDVSVSVWRPHYYSTYCIHELHRMCRLRCKTCGDPCRCPCHEYDRR